MACPIPKMETVELSSLTVDSNFRAVSRKHFVLEQTSICLGVCFLDMMRVEVISLQKMESNTKNTMEVHPTRHSVRIMEKKNLTEQVREDIHLFHTSDLFPHFFKICFEAFEVRVLISVPINSNTFPSVQHFSESIDN